MSEYGITPGSAAGGTGMLFALALGWLAWRYFRR